MQYKVVYGMDKRDFEEQVTELIKQGWKLQGGVCMTYHDLLKAMRFAQAVYK